MSKGKNVDLILSFDRNNNYNISGNSNQHGTGVEMSLKSKKNSFLISPLPACVMFSMKKNNSFQFNEFCEENSFEELRNFSQLHKVNFFIFFV